MLKSFSVLSIARKSILLPFHLPHNLKFPKNPQKTLFSIIRLRMSSSSSWTCSKCTFINPSFQKLRCEICLSPQSQSLIPSSSSSKPKWSCATCTFLNPYSNTICEICSTRASASLRSTLEIDYDELDQENLGSSIGSVFLPLLQTCGDTHKGNAESPDFSSVGNGNFSGNGGSGGTKGFTAGLQPCSSRKRKDREEDSGADGTFREVGTVNKAAANKAIEVKSLATGETTMGSNSKTWKILSYNVWFREDLEMNNRMRALGHLIQLHSPDVICFQEVTHTSYSIFQKSGWWKGYRCSISDEIQAPYFCMQLCKLPVKSYKCKPFHNSSMGRELSIAEVEVQPNMPLIVATTHLESPCPGPPKWDQMFSKERVEQANEAVRFLDKNPNVIFCGDMNWDDKLDGLFPAPEGWIDAWTELKPGQVGWTYDTKSNKMLSGNRALQKRLDRFMCKLKDYKVSEIEMIGMDEIPGLSYIKEKKVKGQVKELELPVLPSDHYGLLLTICPSDST
ncbi:hypothetical protein ACJIZ3_012763 [Penstemon smallii]|uniref:RanBP2-type domain-containing protein n=1 Tax=Penstemon smallii TaxID=265156 RepID=A0ABD3UMZ6_9LAMI